MASASKSNKKRARTGLNFGNITKKVSGKLPETGLMVGGLYGGQLLSSSVQKLVDRFIPAAASETAGLNGIANIATPVILTLTGIILPEFVKLGPAGRYSRALGNGVAAYGAVKSVKEILGKDVMAGKLKGFNGMGLVKPHVEPIAQRRLTAFPKLRSSRSTSL
jgi:hypothetical protein